MVYSIGATKSDKLVNILSTIYNTANSKGLIDDNEAKMVAGLANQYQQLNTENERLKFLNNHAGDIWNTVQTTKDQKDTDPLVMRDLLIGAFSQGIEFQLLSPFEQSMLIGLDQTFAPGGYTPGEVNYEAQSLWGFLDSDLTAPQQTELPNQPEN